MKEKKKAITIDDLPMHKNTYFFGYGIDIDKPYEMANQIIKLRQENQELQKQLEKKYEKVGTLTGELLYEENTKLINQQKEFIEWLEEKIKNYELSLTDENKKALGYTLPMKGIYKEVLEKYKELIGDNNVKDIA